MDTAYKTDDAHGLMTEMPKMQEVPIYAYALVGSLGAVAGTILLLAFLWIIAMYYKRDWCEMTVGCCIPGREPQHPPEGEGMQLPVLQPDYGPDAKGEIHIPRAHLTGRNKEQGQNQQSVDEEETNEGETSKAHLENGAEETDEAKPSEPKSKKADKNKGETSEADQENEAEKIKPASPSKKEKKKAAKNQGKTIKAYHKDQDKKNNEAKSKKEKGGNEAEA